MNANEDEKNRFDQTSAEWINAEQARSNHTLRARAAFDASVGHIDADTRRRLRDARGDALQASSKPHTAAWALPLGAAFATALALVAFWPHASPPTSAPIHATAGAAIVAITPQPHGNSGITEDVNVDNALADSLPGDGSEGADPELLGNLDFYGWLAKQPALARSGG